MASMKIFCCYLILLLYFTFLLSSSQATQEGNETSDVKAVTARKKLGGRKTAFGKMVFVGAAESEKEKEIGGVAGGRRSMSSERTELFAEKCESTEEEDIECKKVAVSDLGDDKEFVAFNADYRAPRHHPPKNN